MVRSSIINKRYNSNEVNYTSENKYICYAELFFQLHYKSRIFYSIGRYYTKNQVYVMLS